jgi:S1-C subfamily serine protease
LASLEKTVPYLGIEWQLHTVTDGQGQHIETVEVRRVIAESPACKAGLREGDVIRSVDGILLCATLTLTEVVIAKRPGATVNLELTRNGKRMHARIVLGSRELPVFKFKPVDMGAPKKESVDARG